MTKTIKRSLIVVLMLLFAITACGTFSASSMVKADEQLAPATVQFQTAVESLLVDADGDGLKNDLYSGADFVSKHADSVAKAKEAYGKGKAQIDAVFGDDLVEYYNEALLICKTALDLVAEVNDLGEKLKVTEDVVIFGSEKDHTDGLVAIYDGLSEDEKKYVNSKYVNESATDILSFVQNRIKAIYAQGEVAAKAIAAIETFDGEALLGSKVKLDLAIAELKAIYGVEIEKVFEMKHDIAGIEYTEDASMVELYVANIDTYVELKAEFDAQVAIAEDAIAKINLAKDTIAADTTSTYKYLASRALVEAAEDAYDALDTRLKNDLKGYVDAKGAGNTEADENATPVVAAGTLWVLLDGIYNDEIKELVDLVLAFPEVLGEDEDLIALKDAVDAYNEAFKKVSADQQAKVNAYPLTNDFANIKAMYEFYNEKVTRPLAMVSYAEKSIEAIELDANGVFKMSTANLLQLQDATKKYNNVPEGFKNYVSNADKLFAAQAKRDEYFAAVRVWAEKVVAINAAPITVSNWDAVKDAVDYFEDEENIIADIQTLINTDVVFRALELENVAGVEEAKTIQYYYALYQAEIASTQFLLQIIDEISYAMYMIDVRTVLAEDLTLAEIPGWIEFVDMVEAYYAGDIVASHSIGSFFDADGVVRESIWELMLDSNDNCGFDFELPYVAFAYGQDTIDFMANDYGKLLKAEYDAASTADKVNYEHFAFYKNYTDALEIRERYKVELAINQLNENVTIVDEYAIINARKAFDALVEENEDILCGQDSVRNAEKLVACEKALKVITDKLDKFVADVAAIVAKSNDNLELDVYAKIEEVRVGLSDDELAYTGVYYDVALADEDEVPAPAINFERNVAAAVVALDALRAETIKFMNELTEALEGITGEGQNFKALHKLYMNLDATQRDAEYEAVLGKPNATVAEITSISKLVDAYQIAGILCNTDWISSLDEAVLEMKDKIASLDDTYATDADIAGIQSDIAAIEAEIAEIQDELDALDGTFATDAELAAKAAALETKIAEVKTELEAKIAEVKAELEDKIDDETAAREEAIKDLQAQLDSTRTLAIIALIIAIVALCIAGFVVVYKIILKK